MNRGPDRSWRIAAACTAGLALTLIVLGVMDTWFRSFAPIWQSVPAVFPARGYLRDLCALIAFMTGLGLLLRRTAVMATRVLAGCLLLWLLTFKLHLIVRDPLQAVSYESCGETAVLTAAAWVLYARLATAADRRWLGSAVGPRGMRIAAGLFGLALIAFGVSHFAYLRQTAALVPHVLAWPVLWVGFFGCTYIAAGAAILVRVQAPLAAKLATAQMALFTLLVWVPAVIVAPRPTAWSELADSWMLTVAGCIVAASLQDAVLADRVPKKNITSQ